MPLWIPGCDRPDGSCSPPAAGGKGLGIVQCEVWFKAITALINFVDKTDDATPKKFFQDVLQSNTTAIERMVLTRIVQRSPDSSAYEARMKRLDLWIPPQ